MNVTDADLKNAYDEACRLEEQGWEWSGSREGWAFSRSLGQDKEVGLAVWLFMKSFRWSIGHFASLKRQQEKAA